MDGAIFGLALPVRNLLYISDILIILGSFDAEDYTYSKHAGKYIR